MRKSKKMTQQDASRIQSHADRTGKNPDFKSKAQSVADRRAAKQVRTQGGRPDKQ